MTRITLNEEQQSQLLHSPGCIQLTDEYGAVIGKYHLADPAFLEVWSTRRAIAQEGRKRGYFTSEEVMEILRTYTKEE